MHFKPKVASASIDDPRGLYAPRLAEPLDVNVTVRPICRREPFARTRSHRLGFSDKSDKSEWTGFDADFCRALAAAIFNDPAKVTFVPLSASDRFGALRSKQIDVLSRNSTWTMGRETELGLAFAGVTFYDGQGLMVRHARKVSSGLELNGSKVCVQSGTTTELNLTAGDRPTLLLRAICESGGLDAQGEPMRFKARPAAPYGSVGRVRVPPMFVSQQDIA